jgi:hypothetical protein
VHKTSTGPSRSRNVLVLSGSSETLGELTAYLSRAGVSSESRSAANPLAELPRSARVVVVFPDDFPRHEIGTYLSLVGARRPELALVIVTRNASAYAALRTLDGRPLQATVLPRPAFSWTILDVIRDALSARKIGPG